MASVITAGKSSGKALLVAGCVPQGDRKAAELKGLSLLGETACTQDTAATAAAAASDEGSP